MARRVNTTCLTLQVAHLNRKTALPAPESLRIQDNKLHVQLSANDLVLIVLRH
jgi:hypothetical protein